MKSISFISMSIALFTPFNFIKPKTKEKENKVVYPYELPISKRRANCHADIEKKKKSKKIQVFFDA